MNSSKEFWLTSNWLVHNRTDMHNNGRSQICALVEVTFALLLKNQIFFKSLEMTPSLTISSTDAKVKILSSPWISVVGKGLSLNYVSDFLDLGLLP